MGMFGIIADVGAEEKKAKWGDSHKQIGSRLDSVSKLIEKSAGAKRVASSHDMDAIALQDQARSQHIEAYRAYKKNDYPEAKKLLSQATQSMFKAMSQADGGASKKSKKSDDFERRLQSVNVLLTAYDRISKEKNQVGQTGINIRSNIDEAKQLKQAGKVKEGRAKLDEAYITAKLEIEKLRRGDTLIRSLHFETPEEEFHYEIDRNNTHQMLVKMLLESKSEQTKQRADKFVEKANELRKQADKLAARKKFTEAISTLEASTKELVRAIRIGGVFIPG